MKKIDLNQYSRRGMFEVFKDFEMPCFATTSNVDITNFKQFVNQQKYPFFISLSFLITKTVNSIPQLRHRLIDGEIFEFEKTDPGFTILLEDENFSFCDSLYFESFQDYREYSQSRIDEVKKQPNFEAKERNHMFFITTLPWFSLTSIVLPYSQKYASNPGITISKFFSQGNQLLIPIGIQVHHALVDGIHVGKFYNILSDMCENPAQWL